jgi:Putative MetA-pathway of phenol degradation
MIRKITFSLLFALAPLGVSAAEDPCQNPVNLTNRPTVTNSVCTAATNSVVLETGYTNITSDTTGNTVIYPNANLRVGTSLKDLEFDVALPNVVHNLGVHGTSNLGFGAKYRLPDLGPINVAAEAGVSLPVAGAFSGNGTNVAGGLDFNYALGSSLGLGASAKLVSNSNGLIRYGSFAPSLALKAGVSKNAQVFIEGAQVSNAFGPNTDVSRLVDVGAKYALSSNTVFDVSYGRGSSLTSDDYRYASAGLTYKL